MESVPFSASSNVEYCKNKVQTDNQATLTMLFLFYLFCDML